MSEHVVLERAESLIELHRPDDALALARAALAQDPESAAALCVIARAHLALDEPVAAVAAAERAAALLPEASYPARLSAAAQLALEDTDAARRWALTALELDATDAASHRLVAIADAERHGERALQHAETAIELDPEEPEGHYVYGLILQQEGRFRSAEQALRHTVRLDPHHAGALSALGETLAHLGSAKDAAELIRLAASTDVRDETIRQDMLRYVRGAAFGFGTWPVILLCLFVAVGGFDDAGDAVGVGVFAGLAAGLLGARERRMRRFPAPVRRILNKRARTREAWEITVPPGARSGLRPWWWILLVRVPVSARAAAGWFLVVAAAIEAEWILAGLAVPLSAWLTVRAVQRHRRRVATLPRYAD